MRKNLNKQVSELMNKFLIRENTGSITVNPPTILKDGTEYHSTTCNLFKNIEERKLVLGWIVGKGLDPWKRGTKEPKLIEMVLDVSSWEQVKEAVPAGRSMFD